MSVGRLRHRIEIGYYEDGRDKWGNPGPEQWKQITALWASVEGLKGSHYFQAQQMVNQADHRLTIRYRKGLKQGMIVRHDDRELTIQSVLDEAGNRQWLTLLCREVVPA